MNRALDADGDGEPDFKPEPGPELPQIAAQRGWQALWQGLAIDVLVAIALVVMASLGNIVSLEDFFAPAMVLAVVKSVVQAAAAWVIRRYVDQSGFNSDGTPKEF